MPSADQVSWHSLAMYCSIRYIASHAWYTASLCCEFRIHSFLRGEMRPSAALECSVLVEWSRGLGWLITFCACACACISHGRAYFKCSKTSAGCTAKKVVDYSNPDPSAAPPIVRYSNDHNHGPLSPAAAAGRDVPGEDTVDPAEDEETSGGAEGEEQEGGITPGSNVEDGWGQRTTPSVDSGGVRNLGSNQLSMQSGNSLSLPAADLLAGSCPGHLPAYGEEPGHGRTSFAPPNIPPNAPTAAQPWSVPSPWGGKGHVAETTGLHLPRVSVSPQSAAAGHTTWHGAASVPGQRGGQGGAGTPPHADMSHPSSSSGAPLVLPQTQTQDLGRAPLPQEGFQGSASHQTVCLGARRPGPGESEQPSKLIRVDLLHTPGSRGSSSSGAQQLQCTSNTTAPTTLGSPCIGAPPLLGPQEHASTQGHPSTPLNLSHLAGHGSGLASIWDELGGQKWPATADPLWQVPLPEESLDLISGLFPHGEAPLNVALPDAITSSGGLQPCWETDGQLNRQFSGHFSGQVSENLSGHIVKQEHGDLRDVVGAGLYQEGSVGGLVTGSMHPEVLACEPDRKAYETCQMEGGRVTAVVGRSSETRPFQALPGSHKANPSTGTEREGAEKLLPSDRHASLAMISELSM